MKFVDRSEIKAVAGASMGTMLAYALSCDKLDLLEALYLNVDIPKKAELIHEVFFRGILEKTLGEFVAVEDNLEIPLVFPICFLPIYSVKYFWLANNFNPHWKKYLQAAMNLPTLRLIPSFLEHRLAIDGGAADNVPIFPLLKLDEKLLGKGGFDLIIVLHFDARYDYRKEFQTDVPVLELDLGICNDFKKNHYDFSTGYVTEMIEKAESYGTKICGEIFSGNCTREELQNAIDKIFLREHALRQKNFSADHLVGILNALGRFFRADSNCNKILF